MIQVRYTSRLVNMLLLLCAMLFFADNVKGQDSYTVTGQIVLKGKDQNGKATSTRPDGTPVRVFVSKPAAQKFIMKYVSDHNVSDGGYYNTLTDKLGKFKLTGIFSGSYFVIYNPDSRKGPQIFGPITSNKLDYSISFEASSMVLDDVVVTDSIISETGFVPLPPIDDGINQYFPIEFYIEKGMGGDDKRLILQPYVVSCTNDDDTIAVLPAIVREGGKYHVLQDRRKDYFFEKRDSLARFYGQASYREDDAVTMFSLSTDSVLEDSSSIHVDKDCVKIDSVLTDKATKIKAQFKFKKPDPAQSYQCVGYISIEDYTHKIWSKNGVFGTCASLTPLKFLNLQLSSSAIELTDEFYEPPIDHLKEVNQKLDLRFVEGKSIFREDSINEVNTKKLADELKRYGDGLVRVVITGYASPDGNPVGNANLAKSRAQVALNKVLQYTSGVDFSRDVKSHVYTWLDVADSLQAKGFSLEADKIRGIVTKNGEYITTAIRTKTIKDAVTEQFYSTEIIKILDNQRSMSCTYNYSDYSKLSADEVVDAWYNNADYRAGKKPLSNGDYYNLLKAIPDSVEQRKIVEFAYNSKMNQMDQESYKLSAFNAYIANRMAIYKMEDGLIDTMMLTPFLSTAPNCDIVHQVGNGMYGDTRRMVVNRKELVATQAMMYLKAREIQQSYNLINKLPESALVRTEMLKYFNMITLITNWRKNLSPDVRKKGMDALSDIMYSTGTSNRAVLRTELHKLMGYNPLDVLVYDVDSLLDTDPKKWYYKGVLLCSKKKYIGDEQNLINAARQLTSIREAFDNGLRANSLTENNFHNFRALTSEENNNLPFEYNMGAKYREWDPLVQKFDSLYNERNAKLKEDTIPYFLAYFQRSFDMNPEFKNHFAREGNIDDEVRKAYPYMVEDSEKYRNKFSLLEPHVAPIPNLGIDTVAIVFDEKRDSIRINRDSLALDATDYILDSRYKAYGDHFTKKWHDHLFLEFGAGVERIHPGSDNFRFNSLTTAHLGVGKQFSRNHSLRLNVEGAFGYQQEKDMLLYKIDVKLDHIFSLSSYLNGYKPDRLLDLSTVWGLGYTQSFMRGYGNSGSAFEAHAGLQFRFFTGPQGYLNIEPYIAMAPDFIDLSTTHNWRRYDVFYGANVSYVYYIHNNLSQEARRRFVKNKYHIGNRLASDSTSYQSWQTPWLIELSTGPAFSESPTFSRLGTCGHDMTASAGKWLSSAIGIRVSANSTTTKFNQEFTSAVPSERPHYIANYNAIHFGMRAEAMLNVFGLSNTYSWDSPAGFHLLAGYGLGWTYKDGQQTLSCRTQSYTAGVQVWARLSDGLRLFLEPRYTHVVYKVPYSNVYWNKRFADDMLNVNLGVSVLMKQNKYRLDTREDKQLSLNNFTVGVGGGFTLLDSRKSYEGDGGLMDWNAMLYGQYNFDDVHSARLGFEYVSIATNQMSEYIDYNLDFPDHDYLALTRKGQWKRRFNIGLLSANYSVNMTNLFCDRIPTRRWNLELFAGPSLAMTFGEKSKMYSAERQQPNHRYELVNPAEFECNLGVNGGMNLSYAFDKDFSAFLSPTYYLFKDIGVPTSLTRSVVLLETINLGVQYRF